ncbi:MAG: helix-turn-helix transcriptional regulator [Dehalococcoidia bacterium]
MSLATPNFEHAHRYERDLTPRQREVLALIAREKTNAEIAEILGVSLDGAKWHVSELLTKLALGTREDAAAYWRWRQRPRVRVRALVAGLWTSGAAKWTLAGAAAVAGAGIVAGVAAYRSESRAPDPRTAPYHMRSSTTLGVSPGTRWTSDFWWKDATHFRHEERREDGSHSVTVADGKDNWYLDSGSNQYQRRSIDSDAGGIPPETLGCGGVVGRLKAASFDEVLAGMRRSVGPGTVTVSDDAVLGGRAVKMVEVAMPNFILTAPGQRELREANCTYFIDPEWLFIMGFDNSTEPRRIFGSVELDPKFEPDLFVFDLPADATELRGQSVSPPWPVDAIGVQSRAGYWLFASPPPNLRLTTSRSDTPTAGDFAVELHQDLAYRVEPWTGPPPLALLIRQRPGAAAILPGLATEPIAGHPATIEETPEGVTLRIAAPGLTIELSSPVFPAATLRAFAELLRPVP